eukprot:1232540-Pleurochrysis_carterae.AAC.2
MQRCLGGQAKEARKGGVRWRRVGTFVGRLWPVQPIAGIHGAQALAGRRLSDLVPRLHDDIAWLTPARHE